MSTGVISENEGEQASTLAVLMLSSVVLVILLICVFIVYCLYKAICPKSRRAVDEENYGADEARAQHHRNLSNQPVLVL